MQKLIDQSKAHLAKSNSTYVQHLFRACYYAVQMLAITCGLVIHAVVPALFEYTASQKLHQLNEEIQGVHSKSNLSDGFCKECKQE